MEKESFENEKIAELLNREYVCVKVDREERPDVDSVYMSVCQAMNGQGGWPLTILMTPDCKPFFSGTYLPPRARYGRAGLTELLRAAAKQWKENRQTLLENAGQIETYLKEQERRIVSAQPSMATVHQAFRIFAENFDQKNGGFGGAPKFPTPHNLMFLMEYAVREKNKEAMSMAETTLIQMYRGGIFDHIGGGFSRYSTDERWLVPHFEKMLYDNALLVIAYVQAYGLTGRNIYAEVAIEILSYVENELTYKQGGFYCGQDADSDGVEGKYYVFTPNEIKDILGTDEGESFCRKYGITGRGNFEGKSISNLLENEAFEEIPDHQFACRKNKNTACGDNKTENIKKLYEYRISRTHLHKDDKILVSWNGWMICACVKAGAVLKEKKYIDLAVRAETFIHQTLMKNGRLQVRYRDGDTAGEGKLDDYACYILALLELYKVTFRTDYLSRASLLAQTMLQQFFDSQRGGFYLYADDAEQLIVRTKENYDGAMPSGNSAAARVLQILSEITGLTKWQEALEKQMSYLAGAMESYPSGHSYALLTMMNILYPAKELLCTIPADANPDNSNKVLEQLSCLSETVPNLTVIVKTTANANELEKLAPYTVNYPVTKSGIQYYLCTANNCIPPVSNLDQLMKDLEVHI